jgi:hypothetical protein
MKAVGRRKAPRVAVKKIVVEIDPCSDRDLLKVASRGQIVGFEGPSGDHFPLRLRLEPLGGAGSNPCVSAR